MTISKKNLQIFVQSSWNLVKMIASWDTGAKGAAALVNLGQRVHATVNFEDWYFIQTFCLIFPANGQILHLSIEIYNPDTTFLSDFSC